MILFLEQADQASLLSSNDDYFLNNDGKFQIMCYNMGNLTSMPNRMLEVPCRVTYRYLQDAIDAKYNLPVQILYIDDEE